MTDKELYKIASRYDNNGIHAQRWIKRLTSLSKVLSKREKYFKENSVAWILNILNDEYFSSKIQDFFTGTGEVEVGKKLNEYFIINPASIRGIYDYLKENGGNFPYLQKTDTKKSLRKAVKLIYVLSFLSKEQIEDYLKSYGVSKEMFLQEIKDIYDKACDYSLWNGYSPTGIVKNRIEGALFFLKRKLGCEEPLPNYLKYLFFGVGIQISPYYEEVRLFYLAELLELLKREPSLLKEVLPYPDAECVYSISRLIDSSAVIDRERLYEALESVKREKITIEHPLKIVKEYWPLEVVALTIHGLVDPVYFPFAKYVVEESIKSKKRNFHTPPYVFDDSDNHRVLTICKNLLEESSKITKVTPLKMTQKRKLVL